MKRSPSTPSAFCTPSSLAVAEKPRSQRVARPVAQPAAAPAVREPEPLTPEEAVALLPPSKPRAPAPDEAKLSAKQKERLERLMAQVKNEVSTLIAAEQAKGRAE